MATSFAVLRRQIRKAILFNINNLQEGRCALYCSLVAKDIKVSRVKAHSDVEESETVKYPSIKPKYPPGKWGDMDPSYAWIWQKTIDDLRGIADIKERQEYIIQNEMSHINAIPYRDHPNYLDFATYATKTAILPWSDFTPSSSCVNKKHSNMEDGLVDRMKKIIIDQMLIEQDLIERGDFIDEDKSSVSERRRAALMVLRCIFNTLMTNLSGEANHLRTCQYDESVIVRAVWDRYGIERKRRHRLSPDQFKIDKVLDQRIASSCIFDGMIRSHFPLPEVHPRNSGPSVEAEKPDLKYKFVTYGVPKHSGFKLKSILAGHILGDPCEYGTVGFLITNKAQDLDDAFGSKIAKKCRLGRGLTSTFTWLAAQAYNQGFNGFIDMTYPLTSQTVMSDGKNFSFIACQLNTLELWKPDSANNIVNLCWHTDEMPLYECIENGEVKGFNDDVLRTLVNMFLLEPINRGYDMKPTICMKDTDLLHQKSDFIPVKEEVIVEEEEEQYIV